jgi:hypothetical protein
MFSLHERHRPNKGIQPGAAHRQIKHSSPERRTPILICISINISISTILKGNKHLFSHNFEGGW